MPKVKNIYAILVLTVFLSGCATKMAYLNTQKPADEVEKDKAACQAQVEASDFKDADLKKNKFNECMKDKGYKVVSEEEAEKIQGFKGLWKKEGADLKAYEAVFIEKVDLVKAKVENSSIPDSKVTDEDINNLGEEMLKRFSKTVNDVIPVIPDKGDIKGERVLYITLRLEKISQTNVGVNTALEVAGQFTFVPLPGPPEGAFSFEGEILGLGQEKLITFSDEVKADKNSSIVGTENYSRWQKAYNVMDYWADRLAQLLAKERSQEYKSKMGIKIF